MHRTWLSERVEDIQNASKRVEKQGCQRFLQAFEKQLHEKLKFEPLIFGENIYFPIQRGCYKHAEEMMAANGVSTSRVSVIEKGCECAKLLLENDKLYFYPSMSHFCYTNYTNIQANKKE